MESNFQDYIPDHLKIINYGRKNTMKEFFWDNYGITYEGAFIVAVLIIAGIYAGVYFTIRGVKWIKKQILARKVRNLLLKPENKELLEMIQRGGK